MRIVLAHSYDIVTQGLRAELAAFSSLKLAFLKPLYPRVYAMGTSVGATSILIALPGMAELSAVIAENPMFSFQRFVDETPAAPSFLPGWFKFLVVSIAK
ncbi:MAG TPA: alpha/beta hydrolase, partial [Leptospiraceae bacterium]|nr:alpha/beta hydrolase [Leptospiraceae bacterium]